MKNIMCAVVAGVVLTSCMKNEEASTATSIIQTQRDSTDESDGRDQVRWDLRADENAVQLIRRSLSSDKSLPTNGKDIKLIIADDTIILRGFVKSEQEKASIGAMARQYAEVKYIDNQLEVAN
jgi:osmotically-inducible protein OsmY